MKRRTQRNYLYRFAAYDGEREIIDKALYAENARKAREVGMKVLRRKGYHPATLSVEVDRLTEINLNA